MAYPRFLLVGLGNPGQPYELTRHNAGFYFLDQFAQSKGWRIFSQKMQGLHSQEHYGGKQVICLKPQTFMNRSGECVRAYIDYFKISPSAVLVIHDDLDLIPGRIKAVRNGGSGGHNGVRSLMQHLGGQDFARLKIGIGRPLQDDTAQRQPVERFVLSALSAVECNQWREQIDLVSRAIDYFLFQGIEACMNEINGAQ